MAVFLAAAETEKTALGAACRSWGGGCYGGGQGSGGGEKREDGVRARERVGCVRQSTVTLVCCLDCFYETLATPIFFFSLFLRLCVCVGKGGRSGWVKKKTDLEAGTRSHDSLDGACGRDLSRTESANSLLTRRTQAPFVPRGRLATRRQALSPPIVIYCHVRPQSNFPLFHLNLMAADGSLGDGLARGDAGRLLAEAGAGSSLSRDVRSEHLGRHFWCGSSSSPDLSECATVNGRVEEKDRGKSELTKKEAWAMDVQRSRLKSPKIT